MATLRSLIDSHGPVLLLDAASSTIQAGWCESGATPRWVSVADEAGSGVFRALQCLEVDVTQIGAFVFCEGPGSVLGIRTSAMAVRVWTALRPSPVFGYQSLHLLAASTAPGVTLIADARRQQWYALPVGPHGPARALQRVAPADLAGTLAMPAGFRHWTPLPSSPVASVPYELSKLWAAAMDRDLLRQSEEPDAFSSEEPNYVKWTPTVHQAPPRPLAQP